MAANVGRNLLLKTGSTVIAGVRTKGIVVAGEVIDVTSDDDGGYRTSLAEAGQKSLDISVDGITKDAELRAAMLTGMTLTMTGLSIEYPNGDTITGDFLLVSVEESGSYNDAVTFTASIQSSGAWTYTAI